MIKNFRHNAARADCVDISGLVHVKYSGPMTLVTSVYLGKLVSGYARGRPTMERLDQALTMVDDESQADISHLYGSLPGCYIVRGDQYDQMQSFCGFLAMAGVMRVTFLASRYELALRWASGVRSAHQG